MEDEDLDEVPSPYFFIGQHESHRTVPVTEQVLRQAKDCGYDMLTTPISTPKVHAAVWQLLSSYFTELEGGTSPNQIPPPLLPPLQPSSTYLAPGGSTGQFLALTSPWIDLASPDPIIANVSRQVFNQEIAYAAFCGITNIIVQGPKLYRGKTWDDGIAQYARAIQEALGLGPYVQLHIAFPMTPESEKPTKDEAAQLATLARPEYRDAAAEYRGLTEPESVDDRFLDSWDAWNIVRSICRYSSRVSVCLDLPAQLPPVWVQSRWYSEPVRMILVPGTTFEMNRLRQPKLSKSHLALLSRLMRLRTLPWILLGDVGPIPGLNDPTMLVPQASGYISRDQAEDVAQEAYPTLSEAAHAKDDPKVAIKDPLAQLNYLRHVQRHQPPKPMIERFGAGYQDYLQAPLQPLTDNLESITYEVFEKDPIKYEWYERAITQALKDWVAEGKSTSSKTGAVVVAVVGAGRGPLVTRALNASLNAGVPIDMYAVEKNPNAYVLLQRHNETDWMRQVTVVKSDMRVWRGPLLADGSFGHVDIIVSELLGSFADNELSPECLDGVQHLLNPTVGISIPSSYTAHLTPIAAPKLHGDILNRSITDNSAPELPHVVMLHAIDYLSVRTPSTFDAGTRTELLNMVNSASTQSEVAHKSQGRPLQTAEGTNLDMHASIPHVQTCWSFSHPIAPRLLAQAQLRSGGGYGGGAGGSTGGDGANEHNSRFWRGTFKVPNRGVCHGLAGYFETVLYQSKQRSGGLGVPRSQGAQNHEAEGAQASRQTNSIELSTNPETMDSKSKDMISWFPIFFPLKVPLYVPDDSSLQISVWRQTDDRKVWYEWLVEGFTTINDRRVRLGITELHSSRKNGCLM